MVHLMVAYQLHDPSDGHGDRDGSQYPADDLDMDPAKLIYSQVSDQSMLIKFTFKSPLSKTEMTIFRRGCAYHNGDTVSPY